MSVVKEPTNALRLDLHQHAASILKEATYAHVMNMLGIDYPWMALLVKVHAMNEAC